MIVMNGMAGFGVFTEADVRAEMQKRSTEDCGSFMSPGFAPCLHRKAMTIDQIRKEFFDAGRGPLIYDNGQRQDTFKGPMIGASTAAQPGASGPSGTVQTAIDLARQAGTLFPSGGAPTQVPAGGVAPAVEKAWWEKIFEGNTWMYVAGAVVLGGGLLLATSKPKRRPATAGLAGYRRRKARR